MSYWLGRAARELRERHGATMLDIATRAGVSESVISRFETGTGWRRRTDAIVDAYAHELDIDAHTLWASALDGWTQARS